MKVPKQLFDEDPQGFSQILAAALKLPLQERAILADHLLQSLEAKDQAEIDEAWALEIDERIRAVDEGRVNLIPGDEVMADLRARFKR